MQNTTTKIHVLLLSAVVTLGSSVDGARAEWNSTGVTTFPVTGVVSTFDCLVPDDAGGVYIFYSDNGIKAQRIDRHGNRVWSNDVVVSTATIANSFVVGASDGSGGALLAYNVGSFGADTWAQRLAPDGSLPWGAAGVRAGSGSTTPTGVRIARDAGAGALIFWIHAYDTLRAQHVDASGTPLLETDGSNLLFPAWQYFDISRDDAGVSIAVTHLENGTYDVFAQRIDFNGTLQWGPGLAPVCVMPDQQTGAVVSSNSAGETVFAWHDLRSGNRRQIYAQRLDGSGNALWAANGVLVTDTEVSYGLKMVADGMGGHILSWHNSTSNTATVFAQRISSAGTALWSPNPVQATSYAVGIPATSDGYALIPNNGGGAAFPTMRYGDKVIIDRILSSGALGGQTTIMSPADAPDVRAVTTADGRGMVLVTGGSVPGKVQRFDLAHGVWGEPEPGDVVVADVPLDQGGSVLVQWRGSQQDAAPVNSVTGYSVWRADAGDDNWQQVAQQIARYSPRYSIAAPTATDGVAYDWKVRTETATPSIHWDSDVVSGASADDLSPAAPADVAATRFAAGVSLAWTPGDGDATEYVVFRATSPGLVATAANRIGATRETSFTDGDAPREALYYSVVAIDASGNASDPSDEALAPATADGSTPRLSRLTVLPNAPNPFATTTVLRIGLPAAEAVTIEVYDVVGRRVLSRKATGLTAGWNDVTLEGRNAAGAPLANGVYIYRVTTRAASTVGKMVVQRP